MASIKPGALHGHGVRRIGMKRKRYDAAQLLREYVIYDQQVEIICCWHSWFVGKVPEGVFERFPHPAGPDGNEVTPDFLVDFADRDYTLVGEVCRLPQQNDGFRRKVMRASSYQHLAEVADVALIVPVADGAECEQRIHEQALLADDDPTVLLGHSRDSSDIEERWVFQRTDAGRSARFRDDFLGAERSLGKRLCDQHQALRVPIHYCAANKLCFPLINDEPPAIYSAAYLRMKVVPEVLDPEEYILGRFEGREVSAVTSVEALRNICKDTLGVEMRSDWIRAGLDLLCDAELASRRGAEYTIHLTKMPVTRQGDRDVVRQIAARLGPPPESEQPPDAEQIALPLD